MKNDMEKNIYKSPRRLRAKYTHRTNLTVYALDISRLHRARRGSLLAHVATAADPRDLFRGSPLRGAAGHGVDTPSRQGKHPPDVPLSILWMPESINAKEEHYKKTCICTGEQAEQFKRQDRLYIKSQETGTPLCSV